MTRTYAAKRLLEHGPLTNREFRTITGWDEGTVSSALRNLLATGVAVFHQPPGSRHFVYRLAA